MKLAILGAMGNSANAVGQEPWIGALPAQTGRWGIMAIAVLAVLVLVMFIVGYMLGRSEKPRAD